MAKRPSGKRRNETPYQYRIRRYKELHPGATTQAARGKPRREHVARAEREIEQFGMTLAQRRSVDKFAIEQVRRVDGHAAAARAEADPGSSDIVRKFRAATAAKGFDDFVAVRKSVRRMTRAKRSRGARAFKRGSRTFDFDKANRERDQRYAEMQELADDFFDDADDADLMFYH